MFCPVCASEFRAGFTVCSDCNIPLVAEIPEDEPESDVDRRPPITALRSGDPAVIAVATSYLDGDGIRYVVQNEHSFNLFGSGLGTGCSPIVEVEVQVAAEDAVIAGEVLASAEAAPIELPDDSSSLPRFHVVGVPKLVFLSLATLGLYQVYWFYKHWSRVHSWTSNPVLPLGKALFAPVFAYRLFRYIREELDARAVPVYFDPTGASLLFVVLSGLVALPEPYSLFALTSVAPLAWAQASVRRLHLDLDPSFEDDTRLGVRTVVAVAFLWTAVLGLDFLTTPVLLRGKDVPAEHRQVLLDQGYLLEDEPIILFYSSTPWSLRNHGSFYTDRRVATYDVSYSVEALLSEIADVQAWLEPTVGEVVVRVETIDGEELYLLAGTGETARKFTEGLIREWRLAPLRR
jgi:hypothetical protein